MADDHDDMEMISHRAKLAMAGVEHLLTSQCPQSAIDSEEMGAVLHAVFALARRALPPTPNYPPSPCND